MGNFLDTMAKHVAKRYVERNPNANLDEDTEIPENVDDVIEGLMLHRNLIDEIADAAMTTEIFKDAKLKFDALILKIDTSHMTPKDRLHYAHTHLLTCIGENDSESMLTGVTIFCAPILSRYINEYALHES